MEMMSGRFVIGRVGRIRGTSIALLPVVFTVIWKEPGVAGVATTGAAGALQVASFGAPEQLIVTLT